MVTHENGRHPPGQRTHISVGGKSSRFRRMLRKMSDQGTEVRTMVREISIYKVGPPSYKMVYKPH